MERHGSASRASVVAALVVALLVPAAAEEAGAAMASLLDGARFPRPALGRDEALGEAARLHALELAERGELDHVGRDGGRVARRARAAGCTDALLGEIIGAGEDPRAVLSSWLASPEHRRVLLDDRWTHFGVGSSRAGRVTVYVAVFARRAVEGLELRRSPSGQAVLAGRFVARAAVSPFLLVDLDSFAPLGWNRASGEFSFLFDPGWLAESYVRLGFVTASGSLTVTNVLDARARLAATTD